MTTPSPSPLASGQQRVRIVVDSTSDVPADWLARWDIPVVPVYINFDQESFPDDGVTISRAEFYRRMITSPTLPRTAAPSPGIAQEAIQRQLDHAEQVVVITVAGLLSSVYNTMCLAAQKFDPARVRVYDSGSASMGLGWQVVAAAEVAARGAGLDEVLAAIESARQRTRLWAVLESLEYVRRGGRVSNFVASLGTLLQIKPIVSLKDSRVDTTRRDRTMNRAVQSLTDLTLAQAPLERLAVLHTNAPTLAADLRRRLEPVAPPDTLVIDVATAFGAHVGPGCVGVALVRQNP